MLRGLGYRIEPQDVLPYARGGTLYKQHIYHYLLDSGQSEALFGEVSRRVFRNGGPCDRQIDYPDARQAVAAIRADGGYAVLAHPGQQQNFGLVPALVDAGLAGLELWHPSNSEADRARIRSWPPGMACSAPAAAIFTAPTRPAATGWAPFSPRRIVR